MPPPPTPCHTTSRPVTLNQRADRNFGLHQRLVLAVLFHWPWQGYHRYFHGNTHYGYSLGTSVHSTLESSVTTVLYKSTYTITIPCLQLPRTTATSSLLTFHRETKRHLFRQWYDWQNSGTAPTDWQLNVSVRFATLFALTFV